MEIRNLTEGNVAELVEKLGEMKEENPGIEHRIFNMDGSEEPFEALDIKEAVEKGKTENEMLEDILSAVKHIDRKLDMIFGGHVLVNRKFIDCISDCIPPDSGG